ncbi:MAG: glycosyltransferase, partial [Bacteroidota bacterium]
MNRHDNAGDLSGMRRIVCFGPGPQFKGGISNYNTALAKSLAAQPDTEVHIVSWTQQYPAIIPRDFVDRSSQKSLLEGTDIQVHYLTNYNLPGSWKKTVDLILTLEADVVIFQWAIALQGLPMGWIARKLQKKSQAEIIFDVHVLVQKEGSKLDKWFTSYGLKAVDTYIAHAYQTANEIKALFPSVDFSLNEDGKRGPKGNKHIIKLYHPVYDLYTPDPNFNLVEEKKALDLATHVFLFFGFIRKYKGLHNVIRAFKLVADQRDDVSLLIVGESFWKTLDQKKLGTKLKNILFGAAKALFLHKKDNEQDYRPLELVKELNLVDRCTVVNRFVANEEVNRYFQVSDCIVTYYLTATPSGVESLAYNFSLPVLATRVGHFPETIQEGFNGYLAEAEDINSMAEVMRTFLEKPIPSHQVDEAAKHMSWANYAAAILTPYS